MEGEFGFGTEAGYELIFPAGDAVLEVVRHFDRINQPAPGRDLVEINLRSDAEARVVDVVVPDEGVGAVVGCSGRGSAASRSSGAVGRKNLALGDIGRVVVVDTAAHYEIAREKLRVPVVSAVIVVSETLRARHHATDRQAQGCRGQYTSQSLRSRLTSLHCHLGELSLRKICARGRAPPKLAPDY